MVRRELRYGPVTIVWSRRACAACKMLRSDEGQPRTAEHGANARSDSA